MEELPAVPGYDVLDRLGAGATSSVWRARRHADGLLVALKVVEPVDGDVASALREAGLLASVRHPHVVHLYDVLPLPDPVTGRPAAVALATQLAGGGSLAQLLSRRRMLSPGELVTVVQPVASALGDLHRGGVVHGDLSTGNVLFLADGMPVVGDLGAGRLAGVERWEAVGTGQAEGMVAPEVVEGFAPTQESDVYQLGALAWLCLTGGPPGPGYARAALEDVTPELPPGLTGLVQRCLAPQPEDRPDAEEVAAALLATATPVPVEVAPDADVRNGLTQRLRQQAREDLEAQGPGTPRRWWRSGRGLHRPSGSGQEVVRRSRARELLPAALAGVAALVLVGAGVVLLDPVLATQVQRAVGLSATTTPAPTDPAPAVATPAAAAPALAPTAMATPPAPPASTAAPAPAPASEPPTGAVDRHAGADVLTSELQALLDGRGEAWERADPALLRGVMAEGSPALASEAAQLERLREEGLRYADVTFRVEAVEVVGRDGNRMTVDATVSRAPLAAQDEAGVTRVSSGMRTDTVRLVLAEADDGWLLWSWGHARG